MSDNALLLNNICSAFDATIPSTVDSLIDCLDTFSKAFATDVSTRQQLGNSDPSIWPNLHRLWLVAASNSPTSLGDKSLHKFRLSLARFTRNLVAAVPENQLRAFENEGAIRSLLFQYSSFTNANDPDSIPTTRMLVQSLSNMITANDALASTLWDSYVELPTEEQIIIRLLGVPDTATIVGTLVLILNCLQSGRSVERLAESRCGPRIVISLLDQVALLFDAEETSERGRAFEIGYAIFTRVVDEGQVAQLYEKISMPDEVVTPHQTVLLKLLDSYLHSNKKIPPGQSTQLLVSLFFSLTAYTRRAVRRALGLEEQERAPTAQSHSYNRDTGASAERPYGATKIGELDLLLPKVCEALVLVTQCLISLLLREEEDVKPADSVTMVVGEPKTIRQYVTQARLRDDGEGFVETLIDVLGLLDQFLPRIALGKIAPTAVPVKQLREQAAKLRNPSEAHASSDATDGSTASQSDPKGFAYLKRDLVRLLGILSYRSRPVQDRVRECGGIPVVSNMCVIDERNPYLREHAIFTLRNLLEDNKENQALVNEIQPLREWDENGVLAGR
ncbi:hypothetical protein K474DRAFT_1044426 [Panus rudis PR-1116 ss-1]|nr:hypothetical protein K474DRAFT_1044426 [Panus rudis PR-1116 ss-1]